MRAQMRWDDDDDRRDRLSNRGMCIECGGARALCGCVRPAMEARLDCDWGPQDECGPNRSGIPKGSRKMGLDRRPQA